MNSNRFFELRVLILVVLSSNFRSGTVRKDLPIDSSSITKISRFFIRFSKNFSRRKSVYFDSALQALSANMGIVRKGDFEIFRLDAALLFTP